MDISNIINGFISIGKYIILITIWSLGLYIFNLIGLYISCDLGIILGSGYIGGSILWAIFTFFDYIDKDITL